ncbi:Crp/Fnr family transcriptional regulator [Pseudomonas sp. ABC1]|uniref:Crp/Fnr family transcriptional regulator n=1 Tax=Pseudomonas sp. ABC1 TaxID=2748080 RepID=UPI0015C3B1D7|nr:Crp/Fnr family transcriptional regulator [Pseudomonas sp. ABC1]QLF93220.1 Crp/Fnr family transcriptional regulator [Pseudomonas sp. ABC1]
MTNAKVPLAYRQADSLLAAHPLFESMPEPVRTALLADAVLKHSAAGVFLFREGEPAHHYLLIESGQVEVLRFNMDGDERVFSQFGRGQLVADAAMFMPHGRYPMNARTTQETRYWRLSQQALLDACERFPQLSLRLLQSLSHRLYRRINEVEWMTSSSAAQRLAAYLLLQYQQQGAAIELPLSQRQLAANLGIRAESLSRLFSDWQQHGYVKGRQRHWQLLELQHITQLADGAQRSF